MVPRLTRSAFAAQHDLPDWRILRTSIEATFRAASFPQAAGFIADIAALAEELQHHPDVDLRYPSVVQVTLKTHAVGGLTTLDANLAQRISTLAATGGIGVEQRATSRVEVAIDVLDISRVLPFWRAVLGYVDDAPGEAGVVDAIHDPMRIGPDVWFQPMDEARPQRNRIHIDVVVPHDQAKDRIAATLAAGGTQLSDGAAPAFWVLADVEGNEACVCTWQGRD